mmetsp:Transcript_11677/g.32206  ORF Transcript_11677/g.32206 Transcript_11677/m.32206 type:complete len:138 (+) Transcript_11677:108-521(+)
MITLIFFHVGTVKHKLLQHCSSQLHHLRLGRIDRDGAWRLWNRLVGLSFHLVCWSISDGSGAGPVIFSFIVVNVEPTFSGSDSMGRGKRMMGSSTRPVVPFGSRKACNRGPKKYAMAAPPTNPPKCAQLSIPGLMKP